MSNEDGGIIITIPKAPEVEKREGYMPVQELLPDGTWKTEYFKIPQDLQDHLKAAQAEWKQLEEAGTPYWCIHKDRSVSHPAAYWKEDGYFRDDGIEMQWKHGVMCGDCGGYIQEG